MGTTGAFRGLQGGFGIGMRNLPAGVLGLLYGPPRKEGGLVMARRPDVVRDLRDGRGNKNGVMWIHAPEGNSQMCQTAADALFLPEDKRYVVWQAHTHILVSREIGHILLLLFD